MVEIEKHIDYPIVAKTHPPMYLMHKYWARKPHNVVAEYIKRYSKEGNIVFDPFCGSGVTAIEALKHNRKVIAIDLDPMATFITKVTAMPLNIKELEKSFDIIKKNSKIEIDKLYYTKCPKCGLATIIHYIIFNDSIPTKIHYRCFNCKIISDKPFSKEDEKNANDIERMKISYWYPKNELIWNTRINVPKGMKVSELFSKRNLLALSILYHEIEQIKVEAIKDSLKFIFSSMLSQASKLLVYAKGQGPGWKVRGFWIPRDRYEMNVWTFFENRYKKFLRGKQESNEVIGNRYNEAKNFEELLNHKTILIQTESALDMQDIPSNSVDYVFTDPPYGDAVPYLELDYMWASWLKFKPDFEEEIIISDSPTRNKKFDEYFMMLTQAFKETFRILKPDHWMTVTFHSTNIQIYNAIIRSIIFAGFELDKIIYQPPAKTSAKAQLAPYGSAIGDYYLRFKKPKIQRKLPTEKEVDALRFENIVIEAVKEIIVKRGEPTTYNDILKTIYVELDRHGYLLIAKPENIERIIKKYEGKEFEFIKGEGWWLKDPSKHWLHITPLQDRVEKFIIQILRKEFKVSFDEILQTLFLKLQNALTPNPPSIRTILEEYATQTKDGKWRLKTEVRQQEKKHSTMIGYLAEIGKKAGYDIWIGSREQGDIYEGRLLSGFSMDKLKLERVVPESLNNIKMIDVLWIKNGKVAYEFEVENTTTITEAITRGSYIPTKETKRFIVIPSERVSLLYKKVKAPILKDRIEEFKWRFIFYNQLKEFYLGYKKKKSINLEEFLSLGKEPLPKKEEQKNLTEYT